jgi:hypothetical protein
MKRVILLCSVAFIAISVAAGGLSSMSAFTYHDNSEALSPRVVDESGSVLIDFAGDWFESGECELFVDGIAVGSSSGSLSSYLLLGAGNSWKSYFVTLKSGDSEISKVVTLFPYSGYTCSLHSLSQDRNLLDTAPAGAVHKIRFGTEIPVAWSVKWSDGATGAAVTLYSGIGTGEKMGDIVDTAEQIEGTYVLASRSTPLKSGRYTLTHFDGVETLTAYLSIRSPGTVLVLR